MLLTRPRREHVRFMKKMKHPAMKSHYSSAMLLIIESGLVYCLAAVSTAPATITLSADAITRGQIITSILFVVDNNGVYIIADMLIDLTVRLQPPALHIISY